MLYHVTRNGQNYGPYTVEDLRRYMASGNVLPTDLAKSDDMAEWVPVAQLLGTAPPATPAAYGAAPTVYAPGMVPYPDPPNLHWALVLLIGVFTCGLFAIAWTFVQAAWIRKVNPNSKALFFYIAGYGIYIVSFMIQMEMMFGGANTRHAMGPAIVSGLLSLVVLVLLIVAIFTMRSDIEEHFNGPEPIGLSLSGVMTFFFNVYYFQYHFTRINELKRLARYRGAAI
jgi:hypothetical protein